VDAMRDNVVIITGASRGIGAELARQLAAQGAQLALSGRDQAALEAVAAQCRGKGAQVEAIPSDVAIEGDCRRLVAQAVARFGRIDTLINNAGVTMWARFEDVRDMASVARIMQVNYMGAVYCTGHALPHLKATRGRIVGVASHTGLTGVPTRSAYAASKHAMRGFFDSLRIELAGTGVTVTMVYPGFVATGIRDSAIGADGKPVLAGPMDPASMMSVEECARQIIRATRRRSRELVMTTRGKLVVLAKPLVPGLVDRLARRVIERGH
jgi:short-subunit dehydrogenase